MLLLDGLYLINREQPLFRRLPAPRPRALEALIQTISQRVGAYLEREGLLVRDIENSYLQLDDPDESAMSDLVGHSITYRIAPIAVPRTSIGSSAIAVLPAMPAAICSKLADGSSQTVVTACRSTAALSVPRSPWAGL
jgi:hypothetical protein